ncbi:unnamed protein product [Tenebrio molitor]|nr:unnamed protein product [Tenebrio molitor]
MDHRHHQHGHPPGHHPCGCGPLHGPHLAHCQHHRPPPPPPHHHHEPYHDHHDHHQPHHGPHHDHHHDHHHDPNPIAAIGAAILDIARKK